MPPSKIRSYLLLAGLSICLSANASSGPTPEQMALTQAHPSLQIRETGLAGLWFVSEAFTGSPVAPVLYRELASHEILASLTEVDGLEHQNRLILGSLQSPDGTVETVVALALPSEAKVGPVEISLLGSFPDEQAARKYFEHLKSIDLQSRQALERGETTVDSPDSDGFNCLDCRLTCDREYHESDDSCHFDYVVSLSAASAAELVCVAACFEQGGWCVAACTAAYAAAALEIFQDFDDCTDLAWDIKRLCYRSCDQLAI